ncbi:hypothetical protein QFZ53_000775 [Microbacterium natoriense]|uniref:SnoaL-like domain-containing protein n=1 Tax=Microbacterium natoriense TaxID=284570 RepID=A0AAW8EUJ5_9MICO|nr:nuclear transport factor 2 family protein [Microbacterium natoriense]MDQ0646579.1 hypothetical protein [Microbacterium natoriense]
MNTIPDGPVAEFIDATNRHDADALLAVFAPTATVRDDGSDYTGSAEIRRWIQEHQIAPKITLDPTSYDEADEKTAPLSSRRLRTATSPAGRCRSPSISPSRAAGSSHSASASRTDINWSGSSAAHRGR